LDALGTREAKEWSRVLRDHLDVCLHIRPLAPAQRSSLALRTALEAGQNAASVSSRMKNREIAAGLAKMSPVEKRLFQDGFVVQYVKTIRESPDRRNLIDMINASPAARERLLMAIGPQRTNELEAFLRVEEQMQRAHVKITANSTTAEQRSDLNVGAMDLFSPKKLLVKLFHGAANMVGRGIDERVAIKIADMLTSRDKATFDRAIKMIAGNKRLMSAIRNPDEAAGAIAARGAAIGYEAEQNTERPH
jgi:hypothetical protein